MMKTTIDAAIHRVPAATMRIIAAGHVVVTMRMTIASRGAAMRMTMIVDPRDVVAAGLEIPKGTPKRRIVAGTIPIIGRVDGSEIVRVIQRLHAAVGTIPTIGGVDGLVIARAIRRLRAAVGTILTIGRAVGLEIQRATRKRRGADGERNHAAEAVKIDTNAQAPAVGAVTSA